VINEVDYTELGLVCNTVCTALDQGSREKRLSGLGGSVLEGINQLTTYVKSALVGLDPSLKMTPIQLQDSGGYPKQGHRGE